MAARRPPARHCRRSPPRSAHERDVPKKKTAPKRGRGRPPVELPEAARRQMRVMAEIRCTTHEIGCTLRAGGYKVSDRTLERIFGGQLKEWREAGKSSLRRGQWSLALGTPKRPPNATMLIWLGKQELGQRDREREHYRPDAPQQEEERVRQYTVLFGKEIEF
jgi:hypothetical protein